MSSGLRLMLFDTSAGALTLSWRAGALLYAGLGRLDAWHGADRWEDGLDWLSSVRAGERIAEIQYWGHGNWGCIKMRGERLGIDALSPGHPLNPKLRAIRERLVGPDALFWFRTCETFGRAEGHAFARAWTSFFDCRAAGHTYVIGPWQSGLHLLRPGEEPSWPAGEGVVEGRAKGRWSWPTSPNTITCFGGRVPRGF